MLYFSVASSIAAVNVLKMRFVNFCYYYLFGSLVFFLKNFDSSKNERNEGGKRIKLSRLFPSLTKNKNNNNN